MRSGVVIEQEKTLVVYQYWLLLLQCMLHTFQLLSTSPHGPFGAMVAAHNELLDGMCTRQKSNLVCLHRRSCAVNDNQCFEYLEISYTTNILCLVSIRLNMNAVRWREGNGSQAACVESIFSASTSYLLLELHRIYIVSHSERLLSENSQKILGTIFMRRERTSITSLRSTTSLW